MEKGETVWKWLIGGLVLCNLALIGVVWLRPQPQTIYNQMSPEGHDRRGPIRFDKELNLTKEQQARFDQMRKDQQQAIDSIKRQARMVRDSFFSTMSSPVQDTASLARLDAELGRYHSIIERKTYDHFRAVREILNDEQKKTFDKYIKDVLARLPEQPHMHGERPGPGGPEDGQGPPPGQGPGGEPGPPRP